LDSYLKAQNWASPLTFDLNGDGVVSTSHMNDNNVFFDIDADGFAEKIGWINAEDEQLAYDANGDGIINDITELFGDDIMPPLRNWLCLIRTRTTKLMKLTSSSQIFLYGGISTKMV